MECAAGVSLPPRALSENYRGERPLSVRVDPKLWQADILKLIYLGLSEVVAMKRASSAYQVDR